MNEQALITDAQGGDLDAFNTLVLHYQDSVFNTALRILGDEDQAADASQEAFISAFKSITSFRGGSFKAWLMRTVTNACYDELRRKKRRPTTPLEPDTEDGDEMDSPRWLADPNMTPSQQAEANEVEHAIHVPLGTIKSRLARARLRLRECLQGFAELLPASYRLEEGINA
jgi:RNA polymerase sigma-70 factor (ECF subfamily)